MSSSTFIFVFGAAGAGKSTFCTKMKEYNNYRLINLDPAQESNIEYDYDICNHITIKDVMEELDFGPNGGLFVCLRELIDNFDQFIQNVEQDKIYLVDFPGQLELFLHSDLLTEFVQQFKRFSENICIAYLIESTNLLNHKIIYSSLCSVITMYRFFLPVMHILSKADQLPNDFSIDFNEPLLLDSFVPDKLKTPFISNVLEFTEINGFNCLIPLNYEDPNSVECFNVHFNQIIQLEDDLEFREKKESE